MPTSYNPRRPKRYRLVFTVDLPVPPVCPGCACTLNPTVIVFVRGLALCHRCGQGYCSPPVCTSCGQIFGGRASHKRTDRCCSTCKQPIPPDGTPVQELSPTPIRLLLRACSDFDVRPLMVFKAGLQYWCPPVQLDVFRALAECRRRDIVNDAPGGLSDDEPDPPWSSPRTPPAR